MLITPRSLFQSGLSAGHKVILFQKVAHDDGVLNYIDAFFTDISLDKCTTINE